MQTLIISFAYLMTFIWALAIVWAVASELLSYVNYKTKLSIRIRKFTKIYQGIQFTQWKVSQEKFSVNSNKLAQGN